MSSIGTPRGHIDLRLAVLKPGRLAGITGPAGEKRCCGNFLSMGVRDLHFPGWRRFGHYRSDSVSSSLRKGTDHEIHSLSTPGGANGQLVGTSDHAHFRSGSRSRQRSSTRRRSTKPWRPGRRSATRWRSTRSSTAPSASASSSCSAASGTASSACHPTTAATPTTATTAAASCPVAPPGADAFAASRESVNSIGAECRSAATAQHAQLYT